MRILYKFASRSRPEKFIQAVENIYVNQRHDDYTILATLDIDDATMNNETMIEKMKRYDKLYPVFSHSANKIEAYNRDMQLAPEWDLGILMSDDMLFVKNGFDREIIQDMEEAFADGDGFLHYSDGNQGANVCTMSILTKKYYDRFGYWYHPSYTSLWCDNEATDVAKNLGRYKYFDKILFRHSHPAWGLGVMDDLYLRNESRVNWDKDERNYNERKANGFK